MRRFFTLLVVGCLALVGCGGSDDDKSTETTPKATPAAAANVDLTPIKDYLLEHTDRLVTSVELLQRDAQEYYNLAEAADFDYAKLLKDNRDEVADRDQGAPGRPHPGQPGLRGDGGRRRRRPVARRLRRDHRRRLRRVGPRERRAVQPRPPRPARSSSSRATSSRWSRPRSSAPSRSSRPRASSPTSTATARSSSPRRCPDADFLLAATTDFVKYAKELDTKAKEWQPTLEDAYTAVVVMTPTMSEYFEAWKNSRFIAGDKAEEKGFVATSRLSDIRDILGGIVLIYDSIQPSVEKVNADQAPRPRPTSRSCTSSPAGC